MQVTVPTGVGFVLALIALVLSLFAWLTGALNAWEAGLFILLAAARMLP